MGEYTREELQGFFRAEGKSDSEFEEYWEKLMKSRQVRDELSKKQEELRKYLATHGQRLEVKGNPFESMLSQILRKLVMYAPEEWGSDREKIVHRLLDMITRLEPSSMDDLILFFPLFGINYGRSGQEFPLRMGFFSHDSFKRIDFLAKMMESDLARIFAKDEPCFWGLIGDLIGKIGSDGSKSGFAAFPDNQFDIAKRNLLRLLKIASSGPLRTTRLKDVLMSFAYTDSFEKIKDLV